MRLHLLASLSLLPILASALPSPFAPSFALQPDTSNTYKQGGAPVAYDASTSLAPQKVPVILGVMSRCPDAAVCESVWDRVLDVVGGLVDLKLVFIGSLDPTSPSGVHCMHGDVECAGNIQQLCAMKHWQGVDGEINPWADWWNLVECMNYSGKNKIGDEKLIRDCAKVVKRDYDSSLDQCINSSEGKKLLQDSVETAKTLEITKSCTVVIAGKQVCIHDGRWKDCDGGHEVGDFVRTVKREHERLNNI